MGVAAGLKDITRDIVASYDVRMAEVGRLKKGAKEMLSSFQASHRETSSGMRRDLAQNKAKMGAGVRAMRNGFQTSHKKMSLALHKDLGQYTQSVRGEVNEMRQEIRASHQDMSAKLKKDLAQGRADRESDVREMRGDFRKAQAEVRADLKEAQAAWQELANTLQAKRARPEAPVPKQEAPDLEAKLLAAVNGHPEGITLTEVAYSLGVAPIVLGRAVKSLADKGKIRKEEKFYFPVSAE